MVLCGYQWCMSPHVIEWESRHITASCERSHIRGRVTLATPKNQKYVTFRITLETTLDNKQKSNSMRWKMSINQWQKMVTGTEKPKVSGRREMRARWRNYIWNRGFNGDFESRLELEWERTVSGTFTGMLVVDVVGVVRECDHGCNRTSSSSVSCAGFREALGFTASGV